MQEISICVVVTERNAYEITKEISKEFFYLVVLYDF